MLDLARLESDLTDPAFADRVAMVLSQVGDATYRAAAADGHVEFRHTADGTTVVATAGRDPLGDTDPGRFLGTAAEVAGEFPAPADEATPYAHDEIAQFFDSPSAPAMAIIHTAAHRHHGNTGEHGSLGTVQRRAPFIASGPGIAARGWVDAHARTADVAPTVAAVAGVAPVTGADRWGRDATQHLGRQDGRVVDEVVVGTAARTVVVLWDGVNANELADAIAAGEAPNAAGLVARGTALRGGMFAAAPSATLANHTTIGTGALPGHSGILHNTWFDPRTQRVHNLLDISQMFGACEHLELGVETLHEAVKRTFPGARTVTTHEYSNRGADECSFRSMAAKEDLPYARTSDVFPRDGHWYETSIRYQAYSRIDETALRCALAQWGAAAPLPRFAFHNFSLTDEAGHEGGPHSDEVRAAIRDSDERLGRLLRAIEERDALDETAVFLVADHGMQHTDETCTDDLSEALAGHDVLDLDGFLYPRP